MSVDLAISSFTRQLPTGWKVQPFRRVARMISPTNAGRMANLLSLSSTGTLAERKEFDGLGRQAPSDETVERYWLTSPGDLVVNPMWLAGGGIGVSEIAGAVSPDYRVYRLGPDLHPRYAHHLFRSQPYRDQYKLYTRADTTFDRRISKADFHSMPVLLPPLIEQRRIAEFLDVRIARLDNLAEIRDSQIALLLERHQSVLSKSAQLLRRQYGSVRVRHVLQRIEQGWSPQCENRPAADGEWGVIKAGCVNGGVFDATQHKVLPTTIEPEARYQLRAGDLLMSRASGSVDLIGSIAVLPDDVPTRLLLCDKIYRLHLDRTRMIPQFVAHMLRVPEVRQQIMLGISGAEGMANNLPTATVANLPLPKAPLRKQWQATFELSEVWQQSLLTTKLLKQQLMTIDERKQVLITAVVTGQIDVTAGGAAA